MKALRTLGWRHPEWWCLTLSACAWLLLATFDRGAHEAAPTSWWMGDTARWTAMVVAMMFPLVVEPVRLTAARSLWRHRHRAMAGFLAGFTLPWLVAGIVANAGVALLHDGAVPRVPLWAGAVLLAAAWQRAPARRRALVACHRTFALAPAGWRAHRDRLRFGCAIGVHCVTACWVLMLACVVTGHDVVTMGCVAIVTLLERYATSWRTLLARPPRGPFRVVTAR